MSASDAERSVILVGKPSQNAVNLQKCVICQKEKRSEKPVSTENGRAKLISASKSLEFGRWPANRVTDLKFMHS